MAGNSGQIQISFITKIYIKSFELVHANTLKFTNAPKDFRLWGVNQGDFSSLGEFSFNFGIGSRYSQQRFACDLDTCQEKYEGIILEILSNHGNMDQT